MIKSHLKRSAGFSLRAVLTAIGVLALAGTVSADGMKLSHHFNQPGNILIADQFNNRVIEVARNGHIVWHFGTGSYLPGPKTVVAPNDAQRIPGGRTLIAGPGAPSGTTGYPPAGARSPAA